MANTWIDVLISRRFPDGLANKDFYWLFLSPLRIPSRLRYKQKGDLDKYCAEDIWAGQRELLGLARDMILACSAHALGVRTGSVLQRTALVNYAETADVTPGDACVQLILAEKRWWDGQGCVDAGFSEQADKTYALASGPRFLAFFAQEPPEAAIGMVTDYYEAVVRFLFLEETDEAAPKTLSLCANLEEGLKKTPWNPNQTGPTHGNAPAQKAGRLLLATIFWEMLRTLPKATKGGNASGIPLRLRSACRALGFIDPGAQEISSLLIRVDALKLQELCTFMLSRVDYQFPEDAAALCDQIELVLDCLIPAGESKSIHPAFRLWLRESFQILNIHAFELNKDYGNATDSACALQRIGDISQRVSELLERMRRLMQ